MLRVGIVHGRRIVEERLLARPGDVTIGTSPKSTFIVPWDDAPERWRLFEERGGRHTLRLAGGMTARIADGAAVTSIDARAADAPARPIPLSDRARGKVTVGGTTVLFQLLRPPVPQPRPQLPLSIRRRVSAEIDRFFTIVLAFTVLLHVAVVVYLRQVDWPRRPSIEEIPDRFVRQMVRTPRPTPPPAAAPTTVAEQTPRPAPRPRPPAPPATPHAPTPPRGPVQVANIGLIPLLTARGPDGRSAIDDVLSGGAVDRSLDDALRNVGGLGIASNGSLNGVRNPGAGDGKIARPQDLTARPGHQGCARHRPGRRAGRLVTPEGRSPDHRGRAAPIWSRSRARSAPGARRSPPATSARSRRSRRWPASWSFASRSPRPGPSRPSTSTTTRWAPPRSAPACARSSSAGGSRRPPRRPSS